MSYWEAIERAENLIRAAEDGAYDEALGISPQERDALTRVRSEGRLSLDDFRTLIAAGHLDEADRAHREGRVDLTPTTSTEPTEEH